MTFQAPITFALSADGSTLAFTVYDMDTFTSTPFVWTVDGITALQTPGEDHYISVRGISGDGSIVVGTGGAVSVSGFVWQDGVPLDIGHLDNSAAYTEAVAVSRDGRVVIGHSTVGDASRAFRWSDGVMVQLDDLDAAHSYATHVSADGAVIAGNVISADFYQGIVWQNGAPSLIGTFGGPSSAVTAVSRDGSTVVGTADVETNEYMAFRWRGGVLEPLGTLGGDLSHAFAVSADGEIVVGIAGTAEGEYLGRAFRWTEADGMVDLGAITGSSSAFAISDDGSVIVGESEHPTQFLTAIRWTETFGMQTMDEVLTEGGVDTTGWEFISSHTVSADGNTIMGWGTNPGDEGILWIARCLEVACSLTSDVDASRSFAGMGTLPEAGNLYIDLVFERLGHALANAEEGTWATLQGFYDSDPATAGAVTLSHRTTDGRSGGVVLGLANIETPLPYEGVSNMLTGSISAAVSGEPQGTGLDWRVAGSFAALGGVIERGYLNGASLERSEGTTTGFAGGVEIELGWTIADIAPATSLRTHVGANLAHTRLAGYTETGGPFPATFAPFEATTGIVSAGIEATHRFENGIDLEGGLALVRRITGASTISGAIPDVLALSVPGATGPTEWAEVSLGLSLPLGETGSISTTGMVRLPGDGPVSYVTGVTLGLPL